MWNQDSVGWLVHSAPNWPRPVPSCSPLGFDPSIGLPPFDEKQKQKAQAFLWVVFPRQALQDIQDQVQHMQVRLVTWWQELLTEQLNSQSSTAPEKTGLSVMLLHL